MLFDAFLVGTFIWVPVCMATGSPLIASATLGIVLLAVLLIFAIMGGIEYVGKKLEARKYAREDVLVGERLEASKDYFRRGTGVIV